MNQKQKNKVPVVSLIVWVLGAIFFFYEFMLQLSITVMVPDIMRHFSTGATGIGLLAAVYLLVYSIMQIPIGILLDRFGPRKLLTVASLSCTLGCLLFGTSNTLSQLMVGRGLIAFGSAFALVSCLKLAANWFAPQRFALLTATTVTIGMLGATCGQAPVAILVDTLGWQKSTLMFAALGFALCILIFTIIRDQPTTGNKSHNHTGKIPLLEGLKYVIKHKQSWITALYGGLMYAPTAIFAGLWGVPYLMQKYNYTKPETGMIVSAVYIGWAAGGPVFSWLSDKMERRKPPMYFGTMLSMIAIIMAIYVPNLSKIMLMLLLFCFGFFSSGFPLSFAVIREINPPQYSGTVLGFMNTVNQIGALVITPLLGMILDYNWKGELVNGVKIYATNVYSIALGVVPLLMIISIIFLLFMRETNCRLAK